MTLPSASPSRLDRALVLLALACAASTSACGLNPAVDDIFNDGGAATTGPGGGGTGGDTGGTTTTPTGGVAGATGGSTGGGGTTTNPGKEDCLNGADEDGDGAIDCADSDCQPDFECVSGPPDGWEGYYRVTEVPFPQMPGACEKGDAPVVYFADPAGPPECTACTCSDVQGAKCTMPSLTCYPGDTACAAMASDWTPSLADGQCHKPSNLLGFNNSLSCNVSGAPQLTEKGTCAPGVSDFPNKDMWASEVGACAVTTVGGGCGPGKACVPKGAPGELLCIQKDGVVPCPGSGFGNDVTGYTSGTDDRSCGACACGDSGATCGGGTYTVYDLDFCQMGGMGSDPRATISAANACTNVSGLLDLGSWSMIANPATPQGSCPASGGAPQGSVKPDGPVTFCCQ